MWNHTGNILLHKDSVGKPKPPATRLPPSNWVYGNHNRQPEKGVDAIIHDWQYHKPSRKAQGGRNFTKMNKRALESGLHTSGDFREMTKYSNDKVKMNHGKLDLDISLPQKEFRYGVPNRPSTPIKQVINNNYGNMAEREAYEIYASRRGFESNNVKGFKPPLQAGTTKAVLLSKEMTDLKLRERQKNPVQENQKLFKMKKFKNVRGVVNTNRRPFKQPEQQQSAQAQEEQIGASRAGQEEQYAGQEEQLAQE